MSGLLLAAIMVAFSALAIGLVRVLSWLIEHGAEPVESADESPVTDETVDRWRLPQ
jgi:hypothetical protein